MSKIVLNKNLKQSKNLEFILNTLTHKRQGLVNSKQYRILLSFVNKSVATPSQETSKVHLIIRGELIKLELTKKGGISIQFRKCRRQKVFLRASNILRNNFTGFEKSPPRYSYEKTFVVVFTGPLILKP